MNKVKEYRQRLGLSQQELSRITGIPRTTISSIEAGGVMPSVDYAIKLARAFGCSVEDLFVEEEIVPFPNFQEGLFVSYSVENKRILLPLSLVEGCKAPDGFYSSREIKWFTRENIPTYVFGGCDPSLRIFSDLLREEGIRLLTIDLPSYRALELLKSGFIHVAGFHMGNFEENVELIKNTLGRGYKVISLFSWEEGIVLREGSKRLKDLKNSLWLVREEGSGARKIFEDIKQEMEIENFKVIGGGHREVAFNIKEGLGDAGISIKYYAYVYDTSFIGLKLEDYCLCYKEELEQDRKFQRFLSLLMGKGYGRILDNLPGYTRNSIKEVLI